MLSFLSVDLLQARILLRVRLESETSDLRVRVERRVKLRV